MFFTHAGANNFLLSVSISDVTITSLTQINLTKFVYDIKPSIHSDQLESLHKFSQQVKLLKQNLQQTETQNFSSHILHTYILYSLLNLIIFVIIFYIIYIKCFAKFSCIGSSGEAEKNTGTASTSKGKSVKGKK